MNSEDDTRADVSLGILIRKALSAYRGDVWDHHVQLLRRADKLELLPKLAQRRDLTADLQWVWLEDLIREHEESQTSENEVKDAPSSSALTQENEEQ